MLRRATQNLITALYPRLSHEDELQGESNSISNHDVMYRRVQTGLLCFSLFKSGSVAKSILNAH